MPGVGIVAERERPVAVEPVGADVFPGEKYPRAVVLEELLPPAPDGRVEDEVGRTVEVETPPRRKEPGEEIVARIEAVPEADEADADTRTISGERGGRARREVGHRAVFPAAWAEGRPRLTACDPRGFIR